MLAVVVILVLIGAGAVGTLLLSRNKPVAVNRTAAIAAPACVGPHAVTLSVQVAPELAMPVNRIAQDWTGRNPKVAGRCVQVELTSDAVDQQELSLLGEGAATTAMWLPDSTTWAQRLLAERKVVAGNTLTVAVHPGIAS